MQRTNNCFDLASVLIKPVQRILKYPLLINELEKATEDAHPDKQLLLQAMDDMARVCTLKASIVLATRLCFHIFS